MPAGAPPAPQTACPPHPCALSARHPSPGAPRPRSPPPLVQSQAEITYMQALGLPFSGWISDEDCLPQMLSTTNPSYSGCCAVPSAAQGLTCGCPTHMDATMHATCAGPCCDSKPLTLGPGHWLTPHGPCSAAPHAPPCTVYYAQLPTPPPAQAPAGTTSP